MTAAAVDAIIAPVNPTIGPKNTPDMTVKVDRGIGAIVTIAEAVKNSHGNQGPSPSPQSRTLPIGGSGIRYAHAMTANAPTPPMTAVRIALGSVCRTRPHYCVVRTTWPRRSDHKRNTERAIG